MLSKFAKGPKYDFKDTTDVEKIWNFDKFYLAKTLSGHTNSINCLCILNNNNYRYLFSGSSDSIIQLEYGD